MLIVMMAILLPANSYAQLFMGTPFSDHMVMQRDIPVPVWGWATPGQQVTVSMAGNTQTAKADATGRWQVSLPAMRAGGPHDMLIKGADEVRLKDVLVGEVWICSGQSNMAMRLGEVLDAKKHIDAAHHPQLRLLEVPVQSAGLAQQKQSKPIAWQSTDPQTAHAFSAVAYFFGRDLVSKLNVPVGLIVVATGATPIELWVPREGMDLTPELKDWAEAARQTDTHFRQQLEQHQKDVTAWKTAGESGPQPAAPVHPYTTKDNERKGLGTFFNGSVAPVVGYGLRGMIWYQGESNRGDSSQAYFYFHKALVNGWRKVWGLGEFPFYYVQISSLDSWRPNWQIPEIWEGQSLIMQLPNTGMVVINDLCEDLTRIHPKNKEGVGQRLALWALARDYGYEDLPYAGPMYKSHTVEGQHIRLQFDYTFGGLKSRDDKPLNWFTIAGVDGQFHPAQAQIDGPSIVVWSDMVAEPVAVRFAWDETAQPNLVNNAGLPASPFRTHRPW